MHRQEFISQREILGQDASAPFGAREREDHLLACRSFIPRDVDQHTSHSAFVGTTHYCLQITEGRLAPSTHLVGSGIGKQVCKYTQGKIALFTQSHAMPQDLILHRNYRKSSQASWSASWWEDLLPTAYEPLAKKTARKRNCGMDGIRTRVL